MFKGDTALIIAVATGVYTVIWLNQKIGALAMSEIPSPHNIVWSTYSMLGKTSLRTVLGYRYIFVSIEVIKNICHASMCAMLQVKSQELKKSKGFLEIKNKILVEFINKYIKCYLVEIVACVLRNVFTVWNIRSSNFYPEL